MAHYINPKTYKHSVNGSKSSGWHVTRVRMDIKKENLIFLKFSQTLRCFVRAAYATFPRTFFSMRPTHVMYFFIIKGRVQRTVGVRWRLFDRTSKNSKFVVQRTEQISNCPDSWFWTTSSNIEQSEYQACLIVRFERTVRTTNRPNTSFQANRPN